MFRKLGFLSIFFIIGLPMYALAADLVLRGTWPSSAREGEQTRVEGFHLGDGSAGRTVILTDSASVRHTMPIRAWGDTVIALTVPAGSAPGAGSIYINRTGSAVSNSVPFTVVRTVAPVKNTSLPHPATTPIKTKLSAAATKLCPDPAANRLDFKMLKHNKQIGVVEISGVAKNLGGPYETKANQQQLMLYEGSRMVASTVFGNLESGQEVSVKYNREWRKSDEFPPTYKLIISYDPDILMDSNPQNDDCNKNNNTKSRSGVEINSLF